MGYWQNLYAQQKRQQQRWQEQQWKQQQQLQQYQQMMYLARLQSMAQMMGYAPQMNVTTPMNQPAYLGTKNPQALALMQQGAMLISQQKLDAVRRRF
jgi:hypothetical protein